MMAPRWWTIAKLELTLALRDREALIWSLIAPIAMAAIFGAMFGGDNTPSPTKVTIETGANPPVVEDVLRAALEKRGFVVGDTGIRVQVPDSLLDRMRDGRGATARVVKKDESDTRVMSVSAATREVMYLFAFRARSLQEEATHPGVATGWEPGPLYTHASTLGAAPHVPSGKEHTLPSMLVMFIMFQLTTFFMVLWVDDLRTGKTKRITMSPTPTGDILIGNMVARLLWAALQVVIILGVGSLVLNVRLNVPWGSFAAVIVAYMFAATALGLLLATLFKTIEKANAIGVIVGLMLAALGGCWWPLEIVPGAMRAVALALPTGQAMDAIGEMTALGPSAPFPLRSVMILMVMAVILLPIAARRMRVQLTT
ncbi:MAG TPA: ABC transporter permease [Candidatus Krumholzibacteria bacterium]|nr:ABC transporter permease [Candidatus Krumholzibacteria bacterium]